MQRTRRDFLTDVGKGMLIACVGSQAAMELGLDAGGGLMAAEGPERLTFGKLEPLVALMQETAADKLLPLLVERLRGGTTTNQLVSAAALANARTFGGEDYVGFHTMMALMPAYEMARELPEERRALPILKVLYRNSNRIREFGGPTKEVLHPIKAGKPSGDRETLCASVRRSDMQGAERNFAALAQGSAEDAFNDLLYTVQDACEVHRVVLISRAWDLVDLIGKEQAHTLLRQSVRYCVKLEGENYAKHFVQMRNLLPKLFDQHKLVEKPLGKRPADDAWVERMSETIFRSTPEQAADAAAAALAEGMAPDAIGEAISLATNQLVLRDVGRPKEHASPDKPAGSVHGDSIGVHACDSANAWRKLARVSNPRNTVASLIVGAYQAALDRGNRGGDFLKRQPYPPAEAKLTAKDPAILLKQLEGAIREKNQLLASAAAQRYGELGQPARPVFDLLLRYAVSEDGALHAEKYYRTVTEEFALTRSAFRWRQIVALARVTASAYGKPAPGYAEACRLLKV